MVKSKTIILRIDYHDIKNKIYKSRRYGKMIKSGPLGYYFSLILKSKPKQLAKFRVEKPDWVADSILDADL